MKLQFLKYFVIASLLLNCAQTFALDPRVKLKKISSEHFDVIYDAKSYELAKIYLEEAERSHQILVDVFGISPEKTVVVLDDSTDIANGSAIGIPRPTINIYTSAPTPLSSVDHYSSWPRDVFLHEYAHILNMEPARGAAKPFRFIFGSIIRPNMFLPRWHLEGLAVEMESRFNENGRLKSTDYDAMIRALYLDSKWGQDNLSAINEVSIPTWPTGQRPYFYGALVWHEMIQSKSISIVKTFNDRYGGRFPWFITRPMVDEFGKTYQSFLKDVYKKYGDLAQNQIQKIQEQEITKGEPISTSDSVYNHSPELSPDGENLSFISQNKDGDTLLYILKRQNEKWAPLKALNPTDTDNSQHEALAKTEIQRASWFPDSKKIVFDSVDLFDHTYRYYDLYTYDLDSKKTKKITNGLRAREPIVSPDGGTIVFVKTNLGKTALYTVDTEGKNETLLYTPDGYERVSRPSYVSPDQIVFTQKNSSGVDRLHLFDLATKKVSKILDMHAKFPIPTSQGIVFTSNKSGVENLYLTDKNFSSVKPLTNSLTKIVNATIDTKNNTLVYSELTGDGPKINTTPFPANLKLLPSVTHPIAKNFPDKIQDTPKLEAQEKSYSALPYMFPQFWIPFVGFADGATTASVTLPGSDPTGFHSYLLTGDYHSKSNKFSTSLSYAWINSLGTTALVASDRYKWYESLDETTNYQGAILYHGFPLTYDNDLKMFLSYEYSKNSLFINSGSGPEQRHFYFSGPSIGFNYANLDQKKLDISPSGQEAKISFTHFLSNTTNTNYDETFVKLSHFHKKWLPSRHVLLFSAQTKATENNRSLLLGTTSNDVEYPDPFSSAGDSFITRGYSSGQFLGYTLASGVIEYRFPISQEWKGPDNPSPYYIKRFHGAIFVETLTVDGIYFNEKDAVVYTDLKKYFTSAGGEFRFDTTIAYHAPITFRVIVAYGFEDKANGGPALQFGIEAPQVF